MQFDSVKELRLKFKPQSDVVECQELYNMVLTTPPGDIVEVGSACGGSTICLIGAAQRVGKMVYSVDPYPEEIEGIAFAYTRGITKWMKNAFLENILNGKYDNIIQYNEDIADCIERIPDGLSLVFIDGCHEHEFAMRELELLSPKIIPGGWVYLHDS